MSILRERLLRRIYESMVNALAMATAYTLTNYYMETIGIVFVSLSVIALCEYLTYVIETSISKSEMSLGKLTEVCKLQQQLIKIIADRHATGLNIHHSMNTYYTTANKIELFLEDKEETQQRETVTYPFFILLQEVLKIISRSAYFFSTYFLVKLYSSYSNFVDEYITLLYFALIIVLAPILFIMLHAIVISPEKKV